MKTGRKTIEELLGLLEKGDDNASGEASRFLMDMVSTDVDLQAQASRIMRIATSSVDFARANAVAVLAKLFPYTDSCAEILDLLTGFLESDDDNASWEAAYGLMKTAVDNANGALQTHVGRIMGIATSTAGHTRVHAITVLGKLFPHVDGREGILNALIRFAEDPDANVRRASLFALTDCISDDAKDEIVGVFEALLADETKTVKFAALEVLTEALPHRISKGTLERILRFLEADEVSIRWRAILAIDKAYPELSAQDQKTAVGALTQAIGSEDAFVKVRAYQALFNIRDSEKRTFPEVDAALERESDFVQLWAHYDDDIR